MIFDVYSEATNKEASMLTTNLYLPLVVLKHNMKKMN